MANDKHGGRSGAFPVVANPLTCALGRLVRLPGAAAVPVAGGGGGRARRRALRVLGRGRLGGGPRRRLRRRARDQRPRRLDDGALPLAEIQGVVGVDAGGVPLQRGAGPGHVVVLAGAGGCGFDLRLLGGDR